MILTITILVSLLCYFIITWLIKRLITNNISLKTDRTQLKSCQWTFYSLLSIDFFISHCFKKYIAQFSIEDKKEALKFFIKRNNLSNLVFSIILLSATTLIHAFFNEYTSYLIWFLGLRFFSRNFEIIIAFLKDVTSNSDKNSSLDKYDRINLAIKSYLEIIIYSATFYLAFGVNINYIQALLLSLGTSTFTHVPFYTDTTLLFNADEMYFFVYLQVFTSISLVVLSIASYIGWNDKKECACSLKDAKKADTSSEVVNSES